MYKVFTSAVLLIIFSNLTAAAAPATVDDLHSLSSQLPPGKYVGKIPLEKPESDKCAITVKATSQAYTVEVDPRTTLIGEAKAIFVVTLGDDILGGCRISKDTHGTIQTMFCDVEDQKKHEIMYQFGLVKNANGTTGINADYSGAVDAAGGKCNISL